MSAAVAGATIDFVDKTLGVAGFEAGGHFCEGSPNSTELKSLTTVKALAGAKSDCSPSFGGKSWNSGQSLPY